MAHWPCREKRMITLAAWRAHTERRLRELRPRTAELHSSGLLRLRSDGPSLLPDLLAVATNPRSRVGCLTLCSGIRSLPRGLLQLRRVILRTR